jgi:hypothetical protein
LYLRDLGGGHPYEHDGDDEDEASAVLEAGTHAGGGAVPSYAVLRTAVREERGAVGRRAI